MMYPCLWCLVLAIMGSEVENKTQAGRLFVEHPTLRNLGFEWAIRGDANRDATVSVQFRAVGESGGQRRCHWCESVASTFTGCARISTTRFPTDLPAAS